MGGFVKKATKAVVEPIKKVAVDPAMEVTAEVGNALAGDPRGQAKALAAQQQREAERAEQEREKAGKEAEGLRASRLLASDAASRRRRGRSGSASSILTS